MGKSRSKLKKSTIITMVTCGSFVVTTFLALLFFVRFPITPSEKIMASIGREGIYKNDSLNSTTVSQIQTTASTTTNTTAIQTTTVSRPHEDFVITITTGKGFSTGSGHTPSIYYDSEENTDYSDIMEETTDLYDDEFYTESDYNDYSYTDEYYSENY